MQKRALEEQYFHRRERELIDKLRRRAEQDLERGTRIMRRGVADQEILRDLAELGYTEDLMLLLHLVPLLQVAWADGSVSAEERKLILAAARSRGVLEGSSADQQLRRWLASRPSGAVLESTLRAIATMLELDPATREAQTRDLLAYCAAIAAASGGILGFGRVTDQEKQEMARITTELERRKGSAIRDVIGR